jgi:integrase
MTTTYDVRIWAVETQRNRGKPSYRVRWMTAGRKRGRFFATRTLAESFRTDLLRASRRGEAFEIESGLPVHMARIAREMSWYDFACAYVDLKWPSAAASYRKSIAEALTTITEAMTATDRGRPAGRLLRRSLREWAFNTNRRDDDGKPEDVASALQWIERSTRPVSDLAKPDVIRGVLDGIERRLDGKASAPTVVHRKRAVLSNAVAYAIERRLLSTNPIESIRSTSAGATLVTTKVVDKRCVVSPLQARTLFDQLDADGRTGHRLMAFFAVMYLAALRPEEAANLRKHNLSLPKEGWGELHLDQPAPEVGSNWTDGGQPRDQRRQLKHRAVGEVRTVPCPPELTAIIHGHMKAYGTDPEGRIFVGERGGELASVTYRRAWDRARGAAFTAPVYRSPLARRPYDLRHAAVSTWLNAGIDATQVAEWAGHSVDVLLRVYAKCIDGRQEVARRQIEAALGHKVEERST